MMLDASLSIYPCSKRHHASVNQQAFGRERSDGVAVAEHSLAFQLSSAPAKYAARRQEHLAGQQAPRSTLN